MKNIKNNTTIWAGILSMLVFSFVLSSCKNKSSVEKEDTITEVEQVVGPKFNPDSAYAFTEAQCNFGPRVMNSQAHEQCAAWIISKFKQYECEVEVQKADLKGYDGTILKASNIIARHNPKAQKRIMLAAHWDSRPWADHDEDTLNHRKPITAANDGASGVAVMIEIARLLQADSTLNIGVDFVCFDAEDWGIPEWEHNHTDTGNSWALGSNYFARNLPQGFSPDFGILLDMVGGQGAQFYKEGLSLRYAPEVVERVWAAAKVVGYGSYFNDQEGGMVTDDHYPINEIARIPMIDIIPYYPDYAKSSFGPTWHTVNDNMDNIDKNTLLAVGQTVIQVLYTY